MSNRYSRRQMQAVVRAAATHEEDPSYTSDELRSACHAVGLDDDAVDAALERLRVRRHRWVIVVAGVFVAATVIGTMAASGAPDLALHNERARDVAVDVLVPTADRAEHADCDLPADLRHVAADYCVFRHLFLRPGERMRVGLPALGSCPVVWVQALPWMAVFEPPTSIEVEADGGLDQKGLGAPSMFGPPLGADRTQAPDCEGALP